MNFAGSVAAPMLAAMLSFDFNHSEAVVCRAVWTNVPNSYSMHRTEKTCLMYGGFERKLASYLDAIAPTRRRGVRGYLIAVAVVLGALMLRLAISPAAAGLPFLTFFPAVTLVALIGGFGPGILALITSCFIASYLFFPPFHTLDLTSFRMDVMWSNMVFALEEFIVISVVEAMYRQRSDYVGTAQLLEQLTTKQQELSIAAAAFEAHEAMLVTDADAQILRVNSAFTAITGYTAAEVIGKNPRLLKSGRHNKAFYAAMWENITRTGSWSGELWDRRKNGDIYPGWITITAVKNQSGQHTHYVGTQTDITLRKTAEEEIHRLAFFDVLTGLPNRRLLLDRLQQEMASSSRTGYEGALVFIDLDNFKMLNDAHGHDKGDLLLQEVAKRLTHCVRDGDTVGRLGGDEFVVILKDLNNKPDIAAQQAEKICTSILVALNSPYDLAGIKHHTTPSIGVTLFTNHQNNSAELFKRADLAMYQAKASGRNAVRFFDLTLQDIVNAHVALIEALRQGLAQNEFVLYFQAQVDGAGCAKGAEALIRWHHPQDGLLPALEFIPVAEESGLILPLGQWVLTAACSQLAKWANQPAMSHLTIAVNVSIKQLRSPDYVQQVLAALKLTGADPHKLQLEVTESILLDDVEAIIQKMTGLQSHGISFALDDFGTGYSSLTYLKRLPLNQLKIDRSFVREVMTDQNDAAIVRMIVSLGQSLGLSVIAEGVETDGQRQFLIDHECHAFQGFLFSRPLPLVEFEHFIMARPASTALA